MKKLFHYFFVICNSSKFLCYANMKYNSLEYDFCYDFSYFLVCFTLFGEFVAAEMMMILMGEKKVRKI